MIVNKVLLKLKNIKKEGERDETNIDTGYISDFFSRM